MALTINKLPRYKGLSGTDPQIQDSGVTDDGTNIILDRSPKLLNVTTPTTPASGYTQLYVDSADKHLKIKDDAGTITDFSSLALSGPLDIADGGTGEATAQEAINALSDVASAINEYVLTKDTATGNAIFKAATGGAFTDSATNVYLTTTTDDVIIGNTSPVSSAKFTVDGESDQIQAVIQGHSTQTGNIFEVQKSDGAKMFEVSTSGVTVGGTGPGIQLNENTSIALDPAGSADGKYSGITVTGTGGATIAFGDLVTLDKDDSRWELVDISVAAVATGDARGLLGMAVTSSSDGGALTVLLHGIIRADANFPTLTIGAPVYASTTGDVVVAQPTTTDYVIRIVGYAMTADELYFNPGNSWTTHT